MLRLTPQSETLDQRSVSVDVLAGDVVQELAPTRHHCLQATATCCVVLVGLEVLRQVTDALRKYRYLNIRRTGVAVVVPRLNCSGSL